MPLPRWVNAFAPAARQGSTSAGLVASECPSETATPSDESAFTNAGIPGTSAATLTRRIEPSAASWKRWKSVRSGARTHSTGCVPTAPGLSEMNGPSRKKPRMFRSQTAYVRRAATTVRIVASSISGSPVTSVGR